MTDSLSTSPQTSISTPGEEAQPTPAAGAAGFHAARFREQTGRLTEALDRLAADPLDEEAVHDARVACRRMRVALRLVRPWLGRGKRVGRLGGRLSDLRSALGAAREVEVGRVTLAEFRPRLAGDERLAADALAAFLDVRHLELRRAAADQLAALDVDRLRRGLRKCALRLERRAAVAPGGPEAEGAQAAGARPALGTLAVAAVERRRAAWLALPLQPLLDGEDVALHRCRIEGKKLRYALEFYEPVFGGALRGRLKFLKEMQDRLGAVHDRADLGARLHELAQAARRLDDGRLLIGYEALARLVEEDRRALLGGFARQHSGVAHAGFVPPPQPEFAEVFAAGDPPAEVPSPAERPEMPQPAERPEMPPPLERPEMPSPAESPHAPPAPTPEPPHDVPANEPAGRTGDGEAA